MWGRSPRDAAWCRVCANCICEKNAWESIGLTRVFALTPAVVRPISCSSMKTERLHAATLEDGSAPHRSAHLESPHRSHSQGRSALNSGDTVELSTHGEGPRHFLRCGRLPWCQGPTARCGSRSWEARYGEATKRCAARCYLDLQRHSALVAPAAKAKIDSPAADSRRRSQMDLDVPRLPRSLHSAKRVRCRPAPAHTSSRSGSFPGTSRTGKS